MFWCIKSKSLTWCHSPTMSSRIKQGKESCYSHLRNQRRKLAPCWCCCWQLTTAHVHPSQTCAAASAHSIQKQNLWSWFLLVSQTVSCCHVGKCSLIFSKDLSTKYIVFCASNLSTYLKHVVEWTGAIWPSSSFRSAVVVRRILQAENLDSCRMNHSEYLLTLTLWPAQ